MYSEAYFCFSRFSQATFFILLMFRYPRPNKFRVGKAEEGKKEGGGERLCSTETWKSKHKTSKNFNSFLKANRKWQLIWHERRELEPTLDWKRF